MIDRKALLADLQKLARRLEEDLRERAAAEAATDARLRAEWASAKRDSRTGETYEAWLDDRISQSAVAWVLACVFVRFLEDNELLDRPYLSGPGTRLQLAMDHETAYFTGERAGHSERDYLLAVFGEVAELPAMGPLLDAKHNPLWSLQLSADGARELVSFWRKTDPKSGALIHDFTDSSWTTRWLGDLYQDLSEYARKRYALLQTPDFVVSFILDRALDPAIQEFGYREVRLIDPTCGSGHFLLDAFHRLVRLRIRDEPATNPRELAQRTLHQIYGVDLSPTVVAIARFRLLVEALRVADVRRLSQAPDFKMNLAVGDSLLHGPRPRQIEGRQLLVWREEDKLAHVYETEDADELRRILGQPYHVVVGNPPYITPKDPALRQAYRDRYESCSGKYSLGVPFTERFLDLALTTESEGPSPAGHVGMITTNSFMKREFGRPLVERVLPRFDLTHVIDMSGASLPGHGTPTVILLLRNCPPVAQVVRAVRGIRGEPSTPDDPALGLVWTAIVAQVDQPGSTSAFVSTDDVARSTFHSHPWSIGGGGATELRDRLENLDMGLLRDAVSAIGFMAITGADDVFVRPNDRSWARSGARPELMARFVEGDEVRDWTLASNQACLFPYNEDGSVRESEVAAITRVLWPFRALLESGMYYGQNKRERGVAWFEYAIRVQDKFESAPSIAFAAVATHNHFVLDRGGKVFKQSAPVIKLRAGAAEEEHLGLLGLLNSSTACFWMQQVCHNKGGPGGGSSKDEKWHDFYDLNGSAIQMFPLAARPPLELARTLDQLAREVGGGVVLGRLVRSGLSRRELDALRDRDELTHERMIALQEELDWDCYRLYGLLDASLALPPDQTPSIRLGERAFEIVMARKMASGELKTRWFERHGSTPVTEVPTYWPENYRDIVRRRIEVIETNSDIALIEQPEYKRRWNTEPWGEQEKRALREWLLDRLEDARHWPEPQITTCARLADRLGRDAEFRQVAELYRDRADFDPTELVVELVEDEAAPFLAAFRYSETGARKRVQWERTWDLQRREDTGEKVEIDAPPRYASSDFEKTTYWRLRGKLDVPKERFILYPAAGADTDATPVIGWAGWDHLQQARALAEWTLERQTKDGWGGDKLKPLLAGMLELVPWLRQWHNDVDPDSNQRLGDYFAQWLDEEARKIGVTLDELRAWTPPAKARKARKRKGDA